MLLRLFAVILACLLSSPALANVIYDVTIVYDVASHDVKYSFSMEFASPPPAPKNDSDLINPAGDFSNEAMFIDGVPVTLFSSGLSTLTAFSGSAASLDFESEFFASGAFGVDTLICSVARENTVACRLGSDQSQSNIPGLLRSLVVDERSPVPAGPTLALLAIGLAGLRLSRGWNWSQRRK